MLGTTVGDLVERIKRDNSLASRGQVYTLADQHVAGNTTVVLNEEPIIGTGSVISMGVSSYYVQSVNAAAKTITVIPNYHGTVDDTHDPPMVVYVDSRFPGGAIKDAAEREILSWHKKLWRVGVKDLTVSTTSLTYNLDTGTDEILYLLDVRRQPSSNLSWLGFSWADDRWPHVPARLMRDAPTGSFPAGQALALRFHVPVTSLRVAYAFPFDLSTFEVDTDLVADVGLREEWIDVLEAGVRKRILSGHSASRSDWRAGGHVRAAEEVSVMDVIRVADQARVEHMVALAQAANDLRGEWPYRSN